MSKPKQSNMVEKLYGTKIGKLVYDRCQELSEDFNKRVQEYVYDIMWAKPGMTLQEKSLITVVSLIVSNRAEQLKVHLWGLFHQGYTPEDILAILNYMLENQYINTIENAKKILFDSKNEYDEIVNATLSSKKTIDLTNNSREKNIIDFAVHIAICDNLKTEQCIKKLLANNQISIDHMRNILQHAAVYCGYPVEMNGLGVLHKIKVGR